MSSPVDYGRLSTEQSNPRSRALDRMPLAAAVRLMNREDARAVRAVGRAAGDIARAVEMISGSLKKGGRIFFAGAGTSGRLGVLEAAECPPTFDTPPALIQALMAGGKSSVFRSKEGAEDKGEEAAAFVRRKVRAGDVVVGVAASGVTAFARAALVEAKRKGAGTVLVTCNPKAPRNLARVTIAADTGAEVLSGSTRLKAGTATKMILNTLTTLAMARIGKTHGHFMVDLQPRSKKLTERGLRLIRVLGGAGAAEAERLFKDARGRVKTAILMARKALTRVEAEKRLKKAGGFLGKALGILLAAAALRADQPSVKTGLDVLEAQGFASLKGKRVGVIVNQTSVDARGRSLVKLLSKAEGVKLVAIFSPEHGYAGKEEAGHKIGNSSTSDGIPVYSLYGATLRPTYAMLQNVDVLVFDLQDVGTRFYTYIATMGYALEAARTAGIDFVVLDRPNPLGGDVVEGDVLDPSIRRFTGYYSIPVRHGLTVGEIARLHNQEVGYARLTVVPMEGWRRAMTWEETGIRFIPPSPNVRNARAALLYSGLGAFEATNVSVGRGTKTPFELFGAPWMDGEEMARRLTALNLPGFLFKPVRFKPKKDPYAGQDCGGVRVEVADARAARPVDLFVRAAWLLRELNPKDFQPRWTEMPVVTGTALFQTLYQSGAPAEDYLKKIHEAGDAFLRDRKHFLLYE